jgi:hypothetical protein
MMKSDSFLLEKQNGAPFNCTIRGINEGKKMLGKGADKHRANVVK